MQNRENNTQPISPAGYNLGGVPKNTNPFWTDPDWNVDTEVDKRLDKLESDVEALKRDVAELSDNFNEFSKQVNKDIDQLQSDVSELKNRTAILTIVPYSYAKRIHISILSGNTYTQNIDWRWADGSGPVPGLDQNSTYWLNVINIEGEGIAVTDVKLISITAVEDPAGFTFYRASFRLTCSGLVGDVYIEAGATRGKLQ